MADDAPWTPPIIQDEKLYTFRAVTQKDADELVKYKEAFLWLRRRMVEIELELGRREINNGQ